MPLNKETKEPHYPPVIDWIAPKLLFYKDVFGIR